MLALFKMLVISWRFSSGNSWHDRLIDGINWLINGSNLLIDGIIRLINGWGPGQG